jgi:hypothetical protein
VSGASAHGWQADAMFVAGATHARTPARQALQQRCRHGHGKRCAFRSPAMTYHVPRDIIRV